VEGRGYFTHNVTAARTTTAVLERTAFALSARIGINGGLAFGDRIFDISSLPSATGQAHQVFGTIALPRVAQRLAGGRPFGGARGAVVHVSIADRRLPESLLTPTLARSLMPWLCLATAATTC
jgi:hypothetical protein